MISKIKKRDGKIVKFDPDRITDAIFRALVEFRIEDMKIARKITNKTIEIVDKRFSGKIPTVEDIQDCVEEALKRSGYKQIAESYHEYREKKEKLRKLREISGVEDKLKLTYNALVVLEERYLLRDEKGKIIETPIQMFRRVAKAIANIDKRYGDDPKKTEKEFFEIMTKLEFLPNSPTLFNAGAPLKQLSACFVLPVEDSLDSIFSAVKDMAKIEQTGGGVGFNFSKLRPKGDMVRSTKGVASGPVSFMRVFDTATEVIKSGGKRRGAMMGILNCNHPDILEFIGIKSKKNILQNFNLSVGIFDEFMKAVENDREWNLINPRNGEVWARLKAKEIWNEIVKSAWSSGDPGLIFFDEINRRHPLPEFKIEATNPCAEQPLLPNESCNLGSINLTKFVKGNDFDWRKLRRVVRIAVHFLDNVIDANVYPTKEIEKNTKANRKIGLGVMGWAEALILLGIKYDSYKALKLAERVMKFITIEARKMSIELGKKRGSFPNFKKSIWYKKYPAMRNATVTTIAPTGTISIIAGCSSGIEPLFAVAFMRNVLNGKQLLEINPVFEMIAKEKGFYSAKLMTKISKKGTVHGLREVPKNIRDLFKTALEINPEWHVKMQAAFQKFTDNSVSKTVNLPENAKIGDVDKIYRLAYRLKCKGITVYRYGSKGKQVLYLGTRKSKKIVVGPEYSGGCPTGSCHL